MFGKHRAYLYAMQWGALLASIQFVQPVRGILYKNRQLQEDFSLALEPFQILYITDGALDNMQFESVQQLLSMNEMKLLDITRNHLMKAYENNTSFSQLMLYMDVRSKEIPLFQNATKVAFGGKLSYDVPQNMTMSEMISTEYLRFLGKNMTQYVQSLNKLGWENLQTIQLLTVGGEVVEYDDMKMPLEEIPDTTPGSMDEDMSKIMYLGAVLIPVTIAFFLTMIWCCYRASKDVRWKETSGDPDSTVWQTKEHSKTDSMEQASVEPYRATETQPDDISENSDCDSVRVAIPARTKERRHIGLPHI